MMKQNVCFFIIFLLGLNAVYTQTPGPNESVVHITRTKMGTINADINILLNSQKRAEIGRAYVICRPQWPTFYTGHFRSAQKPHIKFYSPVTGNYICCFDIRIFGGNKKNR
jgi:hypothetical protein